MDGGSVFGRKSAARDAPCCSAVVEGRKRGAGRHHAEVGGAEGRQARSLRHLPGWQEPGEDDQELVHGHQGRAGQDLPVRGPRLRQGQEGRRAVAQRAGHGAAAGVDEAAEQPGRPDDQPDRADRGGHTDADAGLDVDAEPVAARAPPTPSRDGDADRTASPTTTPTATPTPTATVTATRPDAVADARPPTPTATRRDRHGDRHRHANLDADEPTATATPTPVNPDNMAVALVDRLFWRAGFGPRRRSGTRGWARSRATSSTGSSTRPRASTRRCRRPRPPTGSTPLDPFGSEVELELEWLDRMQRAVNPLPQRMALYWHRHWVISTNDGSVSDKWAYRLPQPAARVLRLRHVPERVVQAARVRHDDQERRDVVVPEPQREHEDQAERELRPRDHGVVLPRARRTRPATTTTRRPTSSGVTQAFTGWRLNGTEFLPDRVTPNPDYGKITFRPANFDTGGQGDPRPDDPGRDRVDNRRPGRRLNGARRRSPRRSTSCSSTPSTRSS